MANLPLRIVVLGDSIMWGQGLYEHNKSSEILRSRLQTALKPAPGPFDVTLDLSSDYPAHSGARIEPVPGEPCKTLHGEIPRESPSITFQAQSIPHPESVRLIIMNGGSDDLGMMSALDPSVDVAWIKTRAEVAFGRMQGLLVDTIGPRFPNATVVICGIYPIISGQSSNSALADIIYAMANMLGGALFPSWAVVSMLAAKAYAAAEMPSIAAKFAQIEQSCIEAYDTSVAAANAAHGARFIHVKSPLGVTNSYGAGSSKLWELDISWFLPISEATDNDNLFNYRDHQDLAQRAIDGGALPYSGNWVTHTLSEAGFRFEVRVAGTAHPNEVSIQTVA